MLLGKLRHVQPDHRVRAAVDRGGEGLAQGGLSDAAGPGQQNGRGRAAPVAEAGAPAPHRRGQGTDGGVLPEHRPGEHRLQPQQGRPLPAAQTFEGDPGPPVDGGRHGLPVHRAAPPAQTDRGRALVDQINRDVRLALRRQIAVAQLDGGLQRLGQDPHAVVPLQRGTEALQNAQRLRRVCRLHPDPAEPAVQRGVAGDPFPVFLVCGRPDDLDAAPAQCRLEDVRRVDGPLRPACAHDGVHFVDKEDHVSILLRLCQQGTDPLLKFAPVFGAGYQPCHVQTVQPFAPQADRDLSPQQHARKGLHDCGFAHPGRSHEGGTVLLPPAQDVQKLPQLGLPAEHRVLRFPHRNRKLIQNPHGRISFRSSARIVARFFPRHTQKAKIFK